MAIMYRDAGRSLHPAICRKNPRGRYQRTDRYHAGSKKMELWTHAVKTKEHDAEKSCLQEKGRQYLQCDQRADRWSGCLCKASEPKAELERKHDSRDDPNPEAHGKNAEPELI